MRASTQLFKFSLLLALAFVSLSVFGQDNSLLEFNEKRLRINQNAMKVLGGWAVGNMIIGASLMGSSEGEQKYFHQMNLAWNGVNLGIAALGYWSAVRQDPGSLDLYETIQQQHQMQKILLFNAGLDIGYMIGGAYLIERSKNVENKPERLKGFGQSIVLQGGFLFVFDVVTFLIHNNQNKGIQPLLGNLYFNGEQLGLVLNF